MKLSGKQILFIIAAMFAVGAICLSYAYFIEPFRLVVNNQEIQIEGWDKDLDGFRAVLISDIHAGSRGVDAEKLRRLVETANAQNADAIFLLGDFVSQQRIDGVHIQNRPIKVAISDIADQIAGLRAKHGVFAVLGNHDGWYEPQNIKTELTRVGIRVLNGEVAVIEQNGRRIRIAGLKDHLQYGDWNKMSADAKTLLAPSEGTGPVIVLEHSPDVLPMITGNLLASRDLKVMFAGHTHGGQVWLPILGRPVVPSIFGQKYAAGHTKDAGLDLFVTTGIGTSILPFRFMVPPEIAVVSLRSK